jgi:hypothetical protein
VHGERAICGAVALPCEVPLVVTLHDNDLRSPPKPSPAFDRWLVPRIGRRVARRADAVIVPSEESARSLPEGVSGHVVPWGDIDLELFAPGRKADARRALGLPPNRELVLFLSSPFADFERYERAIEALALLRPRYDATLVPVDGDVDGPTLASYMVACDALLLIHPRPWWEITVRRALASALPVVAVRVSHAIDWIEGIPACSHVEELRPSSIAGGLAKAFAESGGLARTVFDEFDERRSAERVLSVYETLVRTRRSANRA